jgi:S1/P1 Nuclease
MAKSGVKMHCISLYGAVLLLLGPAVVVVEGWGKQGHEIVGNVASMLLSSRVLAKIALVLENVTSQCDEQCSPLAKVADWADQVRYRYHWSAPLHYIDIADDLIPSGCPATASLLNTTMNLCFFDYARDCPDDLCVAGAIVNYTSRLMNRYDGTTTVANRNEMDNQTEDLMFLVHYVGDIHQPLHSSRKTDRGGNSIHVHFDLSSASTNANRWFGPSLANVGILSRHLRSFHVRQRQSLNLHAVWDDSIIETTLTRDHDDSRNALEASLLAYIWHTSVSDTTLWNDWLHCANGSESDCTIGWGKESFAYAIRYAYQNVDGMEVMDGTYLSNDYYTSRLPIVRERLAAAAIRLAVTLERIYA